MNQDRNAEAARVQRPELLRPRSRSLQGCSFTKKAHVQITGVPGGQHENDAEQRNRKRTPKPLQAIDPNRENQCRKEQGDYREAKNMVKVEPKEQDIPAQQGAEQGPHRIPAVEASGEIAQVVNFPAHLVKEKRERSTGKNDREAQHDEHDQESEDVIEAECCALIPKEAPKKVSPVGRVLERAIETDQ